MYLLFAGEAQYNSGGIDDLAGVFETLGEAQEALDNENGWGEIALVEGNTLRLVSILRNGGVWRAPMFEAPFTTGKEKE